MGLFIKVFDSVTKKVLATPYAGSLGYPGFTDYIETVVGSAKSTFTIGVDIDALHKLDVSIDGRDQPIENTHWTRDVSANTVTMSEPIKVGSIFKCRIYLK